MAAEVGKPDFSFQWASGGSIVAPSDVKIQTGWTAEVPPFQWENFLQNRQDNAILHLFQKGISEWDATSDYYFTSSGVRSYVQGSDGQIYVALQDSLNQNPVSAPTFWAVAFPTTGRLVRTTVYRNNAGTLQASVDGGAYTNVSSTFTKHPLSSTAEVELVAGGGGGGVAASSASGQVSSAPGGAGGGYARKTVSATTLNGLTVSVGLGGISNIATGSTAGGPTSIGGVLSATGGAGGATAVTGPISNNPFGASIAGSGTGGEINADGGHGLPGLYTSTPLGGAGGSSFYGAGARPISGAPTTGTAGINAVTPGAGGGGAANGSAVPVNVAGGVGANGSLTVKEYA